MTKKVCFIILHFGENKDITKKAIQYVRKLPFDGIADIVVVCNGNKYDISNEINTIADVLVLEKNEGFSKGNNAGYSFAKKKDDYDFMIIMNNDVFIEQTNFLPNLYKLYEEHPFFVSGPDIYIPFKDKHTSPMRKDIITIEDIEDFIQKSKNSLNHYEQFFSLDSFCNYFSESFKNRDVFTHLFRLRRKIKKHNIQYQGIQENVVLQGSCLIFSKDYIIINEKAFEPEVFLYGEEDYLSIRCKKNNWKIIYSDDLQVSHIHHGSTGIINLSYREYCKKKIENIKVRIASNEQLKKYIETNEVNISI